jgi:uncharacterized membrane protein YesL
MKHLLTLTCLAGALACYLLSFQLGAAVLFVAGALLEFTFWMRIIRFRRVRRESRAA